MTSPTISNVSVIAPVELAIGRVKEVLFRPFDLGKWIVIGFCAWLATLGEGGSMGNSGNIPSSDGKADWGAGLGNAKDYCLENLLWIIPVVVVLTVIFLAICVAVIWLSSRGRFMLLHCVAHNCGEVAVPWKKFAREARSLWLFRLALGAIWLVGILAIVAAGVVVAVGMSGRGSEMGVALVVLLVVGSLVFLLGCMILIVIGVLTTDFIVPIMFLRGGTCSEGWRVLGSLLSANPGRFVLYLIFKILLAIGMGFLVLLLVICTCCVAGCLMLIPFVGTVVLLPLTVFARSYSLYYLAQYGSEFDVFLASAESSIRV